MGGCGSKEDETTAEIDRKINEDAKEFNSITKILLLGAGQTGKTTFMKQIQHLYADGFDKDKIRLFKRIIATNITDFAENLIEDMEKQGECSEATAALKPILDSAEKGGDMLDKDLGEALIKFWKRTDVREYVDNSKKWKHADSFVYFFERLGTISKSGYQPSPEDLFRCRVKTTGIYELKFHIVDNAKRKRVYSITDVGGQRSERNKWIHCFEQVVGVIFFVDISAFDLTLDEAPTHPRMQESLSLFEAICNSQWFRNSYMILFFNKMDVFREKLTSVRFAEFFPEYQGDNDADSIAEFWRQKFLSLNRLNPKKPVYIHFTTATDTKNVKVVFSAIADVIVRKSLKEAGLL